VQANAEIRRLRREVEIRDAGIEMGVALVRFWRGLAPRGTDSWFVNEDQAWARMTQMHEADEAARAAHPLNRGGA
jgi:hypothetical protein